MTEGPLSPACAGCREPGGTCFPDPCKRYLASKSAGHPKPIAARLDLKDLRAANDDRQREWCVTGLPDLAYRGNELAGEVGEACNVIKKLERERYGWRGSRATVADLASELADVIICVDLAASAAGIDLAAAVRAKFNETSDKNGLSTKLTEPANG